MKVATLSRTFSLFPESLDKNKTYRQINDRLVKFRDLENIYVRVLLRALDKEILGVDDFAGESKAFVKKNIYNRLKLNKISSEQFKSFELKERTKRCAIQYPYFAVRLLLQRNEYLSIVLKELSGIIRSNPRHAITFLRGKTFSRKVLKQLFEALKIDCFGRTTFLSYFYLNNLVGQVRNAFLCTTRLEPALKARLEAIMNDEVLIRGFLHACLKEFTRKKKGKWEFIPVADLPGHFLKRYLMRVKRFSTWKAKRGLSVVELDSFKREREVRFKEIISNLRNTLTRITPETIFELAQEAFEDMLNEYDANSRVLLSRHLFKSRFRAAKVKEVPGYEDFLEYFKRAMKNHIKKRLRDLFLTPPILKLLCEELTQLSASIRDLVSPPKIKKLSIPMNQAEQVYEPDFQRSKVKVSFVSREAFEFTIRDDKGRIHTLVKSGATPCLPVLAMKGRKIVLHLPFDVKRKVMSKPSHTALKGKRVEVGVDLGVRYPAVLSVMDRTNPKLPVELARYFLGVNALLDMKFNATTGHLEFRSRFTNSLSNRPSNQKAKLKKLRRVARYIQSKLHEYENRLIQRGVRDVSNKFKYNQLKRTLSGLWERIKNSNLELVRLLNHFIVEIAAYYGASVVKFENLKWSKHSKKQKTGKNLAFWQAHWFFSQVQEAIKLQASLRGIKFRTVKAAYTSQDCWECGRRGTLSGKSFICRNTKEHASGAPVRLQSDLNAARNVALAVI